MGKRDYHGCPPDVVAYIEGLARRLTPKAIILFGSQARGDAEPFSDYDLLVIADDLPRDLWQRLDLLWEDKPSHVDALGFTEAELGAALQRALILDALLDGRVVWGNIDDWRQRARQYVAEANLRKTPWGYLRREAAAPQ